jgi:hypothetical protein
MFTCRDCGSVKRAKEQVRLKNWCKECQRLYGNNWNRKNPDKARVIADRYRATQPVAAKARKTRYYYRNVEHEKARSRAWYAKTWLKHSLRAAAKRAPLKGVPFTIRFEDIEVPKICPVLGIVLNLGTRGGFKDSSPTIDRVIPERGYVCGNVAVISKRANTIKNCGTAAEHRRIAEWMESFEGARVDGDLGVKP